MIKKQKLRLGQPKILVWSPYKTTFYPSSSRFLRLLKLKLGFLSTQRRLLSLGFTIWYVLFSILRFCLFFLLHLFYLLFFALNKEQSLKISLKPIKNTHYESEVLSLDSKKRFHNCVFFLLSTHWVSGSPNRVPAFPMKMHFKSR